MPDEESLLTNDIHQLDLLTESTNTIQLVSQLLFWDFCLYCGYYLYFGDIVEEPVENFLINTAKGIPGEVVL